MLNAYVGYTEETHYLNIRMMFEDFMDDEWFDDPFVKELIKVIDKSDVVGPHLIESPVLGPIPPADLSGGVKCLIMLYKCPEIPMRGSAMGENCLDPLMEIGKRVDCTVYFDVLPDTKMISVELEAYFPQVNKYASNKCSFAKCIMEAYRVWRIQNKDKFEKIDI